MEKAFTRLRRFVLRRRNQYVFHCTSASTLHAMPTPSAVHCVDITSANLHQVEALRGPAVCRMFAMFLEAGHIGLYALKENRVIGHAWLIPHLNRPRHVNGYFPLKPRQGLIHFCYVTPEMRGRNVFPAMLVALARRAFDADVTELFVDTSVENISSIRGILKAGFEPAGRLVAFVAFGFCLYHRLLSESDISAIPNLRTPPTDYAATCTPDPLD